MAESEAKFVEHIRLVHFTLAVAAAALLIAVTSTRESALRIAADDIERIAALHDYVKDDLWMEHIARAKISSTGPASMYTFELDGRTYGIRYPARPSLFRRGEFEKKNYDFALTSAGWGGVPPPGEERLPWIMRKHSSVPATLKDWRVFWDDLQDRRACFVRPPENVVKVIVLKNKTQLAVKTKVAVKQAGWGEPVLQFTPLSVFKEEQELWPEAVTHVLVPFFAVSNTDTRDWAKDVSRGKVKFDFREMANMRILADCTYIDLLLQQTLATHAGKQWRVGSFATSFPELAKLTEGLDDITIQDLAKVLMNQAQWEPREVEVIGLKIPLTGIAGWGLVVLVSVQLYYVLHLTRIKTILTPQSEGWNVAWIALYDGLASRLATLITSAVFPAVVAGFLVQAGLHEITRRPGAESMAFKALFATGMALEITLACFTVLYIRRLRKQ